jgi:hypothetical protein
MKDLLRIYNIKDEVNGIEILFQLRKHNNNYFVFFIDSNELNECFRYSFSEPTFRKKERAIQYVTHFIDEIHNYLPIFREQYWNK